MTTEPKDAVQPRAGFVAVGCAFLSEVLLTALLPLYPRIEAAGKIDSAEFGIAVALFPAGFLLTSVLIWRYPRVRPGVLVRVGLVLVGLSAPLLTPTLGIVTLGTIRALHGGASGILWASALAVTMAVAPPGQGGRSLGSLFGAGIAGALVGPVLGGIAADVEVVAVPFLAITACCVALLLRVRRFGEMSGHEAATPSIFRPPSGFLLCLIPPALFASLAVMVPVTLTSAGVGAKAIAVTFLVAGAAEVPALRISGHVSDRFGPRRVLVPLFLAAAPVCLLVGLAPTPLLAAVGVAVASMFIGGLYPPCVGLLKTQVRAVGGSHAEAAALSNIAWALGQAIGAGLIAGVGPGADPSARTSMLVVPCLVGAILAMSRRIHTGAAGHPEPDGDA